MPTMLTTMTWVTRRGRDLPGEPGEWTRRRLQVLLAILALCTLVMVAGAGWYAVHLIGDARQPTPLETDATGGREGDRGAGREPVLGGEDELANRSLPQAAPEDSQPGPLTTQTAGRIVLPPATALGPARVPAGFPRTPEGALAQLIAIDRTALESASVARAQEVIAGWAVAGGPTTQTWSGVAAVATFLSAGDFPAGGAPELTLVAEPSMGLIKGSVGVDFVVPCVDFVLTATAAGQTHRVAVADCQRMVWTGDRWMIGRGPEPAAAPSLWPGTRASLAAGYQWLEMAQ